MKSNDSPLKEVLKQWMNRDKVKDRLWKVRIETVWEETWGNLFGRHTKNIRFQKGVLYIHLNSSVLRHELTLQRDLLIKRINEELGEEAVKEIKLM